MTAIRIIAITLTCNSHGCTEKIETTEPSVYGARIAAGVRGWRYVTTNRQRGSTGQRDSDYCPDCVRAREAMTPVVRS